MKLDGNSFGCGLVTGAGLVLVIIGLFGVLGGVAYLVAGMDSSEQTSPPLIESIPAGDDETVTVALKPILQEHNVPAIAAAVSRPVAKKLTLSR